MLEHVLNHWVSRGGDFKAGRIVERGTAPIRFECVSSEGGDRINTGYGACRLHERLNPALRLCQQFIPQGAFDLGGSFLGRQCLVFVLLKFRCDKAFDIFKCLPTAVVLGNFVALAAWNFDEVAGDAVIFDSEIIYSCALFFPLLLGRLEIVRRYPAMYEARQARRWHWT